MSLNLPQRSGFFEQVPHRIYKQLSIFTVENVFYIYYRQHQNIFKMVAFMVQYANFTAMDAKTNHEFFTLNVFTITALAIYCLNLLPSFDITADVTFV